jgi:hypothetical protein
VNAYTLVRDHFVPVRHNAATLVANNPFLPDAPTPAIPSQGNLDYNVIHMWNLRMNAERENATTPRRHGLRGRWRPGMPSR